MPSLQSLFTRVRGTWRGSRASLRWSVREGMSLTFPDGKRIEATADALAQDPDGKIVIAPHKVGRPRGNPKDLRNDDRHALFVAAAQEAWPGRPVEMMLHHLPGNEMVDVKPADNVVSRRVKKLKGYAHRIAENDFPPKLGRECKSCTWNLVCPSSA